MISCNEVNKILTHTAFYKKIFLKQYPLTYRETAVFVQFSSRGGKKRPSKSTGNALKSSARTAPAERRQLNFFAISRQRKLEICVSTTAAYRCLRNFIN